MALALARGGVSSTPTAFARGMAARAASGASSRPPRGRAPWSSYRVRASAATAVAEPAPALTYVDTHCHLDLIFDKMNQPRPPRKGEPPRAPDPEVDYRVWRDAVRASESTPEGFLGATLEACLTVACSSRAHARVDRLLDERHDGIFAAYGCHPLSAAEWTRPELNLPDLIRARVRDHPRVVAVGECGLDYHAPRPVDRVVDPDYVAGVDDATKDAQRRAFVDQMALATELGAPIVVHTRDAEEDTLALMTAHLPADARVHVHCFTSAPWLAEALLERFPNLCLGFTGAVTFKKAEEVREAARVTPLDRILLETDGPYMAPVPRRGEIAHPGLVPHIAKVIADVKGVTVEEVFAATREATRRTYGF